jgi:transcriptional regulator with XRE-family HTH domain
MLNVIEKLILKQEDYPHIVAARLCAYTGKSPSTMDRYRQNRDSIIDARTALKIAEFFEVEVSDLYEEVTPVELDQTLTKQVKNPKKKKY